MQDELKARTSEGIPYYSKIDYEFLNRMAAALTKGSKQYDPHVLVENWRFGDVNFFHDRANHGIEHIMRWLDGDRTEDHLAHAACNLMMLMWAEEQQIYNPASPEIRTLQYIDYVKANRAQKEAVTNEKPGVTKLNTEEVDQSEVSYESSTDVNNSMQNVTQHPPDGAQYTLMNGKPVDTVEAIANKLVFDFNEVKKVILG